MTLPDLSDVSVFEERQISSAITVEDASAFYDQHGIFYYADANIGTKATELGPKALADVTSLGLFEIQDPRLKKILEPYEPAFTFIINGRKGPFYALRVNEDENLANQAVVYIFSEPTTLEFFPCCHTGPLKGRVAPNGLWQIPYPFLKQKRELVEKRITMDEGGILMIHPRHAFGFRCEIAFIAAYAMQKRVEGPSVPK